MARKRVMDSFSLVAFLENAEGGDKVASMIKQARDKGRALLVSAATWADAIHAIASAAGKSEADKALQIIETLPIEIVPLDRQTAEIAASLKAASKIPLIDCFAVALAKLRKATLVTGNKSLKELASTVDIEWI